LNKIRNKIMACGLLGMAGFMVFGPISIPFGCKAVITATVASLFALTDIVRNPEGSGLEAFV
jgi:uncharacterized membrane protein YgaE (UPF0421/DUF939 family)